MPDLLFTNANVVTLDPALARARSIRVRGDRIIEVSAQANQQPGSDARARRIDCAGRTIVPGFIDAHGHVFAHGERLLTLDLGPGAVDSIEQIGQRLRARADSLPRHEWIRARGYDEFHLLEKRHPTRHDLDAAAPAHPVRLTHRSGHAHVLNSVALALAGITHESEDPRDGVIDRDLETGEPTGLLYGMHELVARVVPRLSGAQADRAIELASESLVAFGVTTVHDTSARNDLRRLESFREWALRGRLRTRVRMAIGWAAFQRLARAELAELAADAAGTGETDRVSAAGVKVIVHEATGRLSPPQSELDAIVEAIHRSGWQAILHAVEPATIAAACAAIERAVARAPRADHRHRIEHGSVCPPELARRIAAAGITVVTHPGFVYFNGERYLRTMPAEETRHLYPLRTLSESGVALAGSADFPVSPPDPLAGIRAAVTRRAANGERVGAQQAIDAVTALRLYTTGAARALRVEHDRGSIRSGALADFVILDADPTGVKAGHDSIGVSATWIGGEMVFERRASERRAVGMPPRSV